MPVIRKVVEVEGVVQGIGFRPSVSRLARAVALDGYVQNRPAGVRISLQGDTKAVNDFLRDLSANIPQARVDRLAVVEVGAPDPALTGHGFHILESEAVGERRVQIPPDLAMCPDCRRDVLAPGDRRYGYPFTTCTRCGPRYTVVEDMPYDRTRTTLNRFPLCDACAAEYQRPDDRRYHAESIACPACGPKIWLETADGTMMRDDVLRHARARLAAGEALAVRGLGGFLLAVDAFNREAIARLRLNKKRPHKPFAVMARDLETLARYVPMSPEARDLLTSPASPIVTLDVPPDGPIPMDLINPDAPTLGVMVPTTPLHHLLFHPLAGDPTPPFDLLIMTSGNRRGEPIAITNAEARERLNGLADAFLLHDREIRLRCDDSIVALQPGGPQVWRRARGYAPEAVPLSRPLDHCALAMGAGLKNTIALGYDDRVVLSPHVGDLDSPEALTGFEQVVQELPRFLDQTPQVVAVDLHPDLPSTHRGERYAQEHELPLVRVQHHHAHAVACLAEHGRDEGLALVMDGLGWGGDGTIWGAELIWVARDGFERLATFEPVPLPGGDAAVMHPVRQLAGRCAAYGLDLPPARLTAWGVEPAQWQAWLQQSRKGLNAPPTHAAGRVFDAVAVLLGLAPATLTYDAQAAVRLEAAAAGASAPAEELTFDNQEKHRMLWLDWRPTFARLAELPSDPVAAGPWARSFHESMAAAAVRMIEYGVARHPVSAVALSGGVMMNRLLNQLLVPRLRGVGLEPLLHRRVPPNDGAVALGQAVIAGRMKKG